MQTKLNAPGDFAMAYVVAHEVGHHVQNLLGITEKLDRMRSRLSESEYNKQSVNLELQADFLAGVWAHYDQQMKHVLDAGDVDGAATRLTKLTELAPGEPAGWANLAVAELRRQQVKRNLVTAQGTRAVRERSFLLKHSQLRL
jgi:hypothetical protein